MTTRFTSRSLNDFLRTVRAAHARSSDEWIRRMEVSTRRSSGARD
jgi:hypothetical protein